MEIFWRLILGHMVADFTLQTNYLAAWKRRNLWGLLVHCAIHPVVYSVLLWKYLGQTWIQVGPVNVTGCVCVLLIFVSHFIEDEWRIWSVLRRNAPDNMFFYVWDQVIHYSVIFALSPVVEGAKSKFGFIYFPPIQGVLSRAQAAGLPWAERFLTIAQPEPWVFIAILFVIVTHFTTVTIYFLEKDFFGGNYPGVYDKYVAMGERTVVMACFLLPGLWWCAVLAAWLLRAAVYKSLRMAGFTWANVLVGNLTAVFCGVIARLIFYA